jgi:hypothetical protein
MKRTRVIWLAASVLMVPVVFWIATHTYWADTRIPMPPKGEALTNPFYAVQRFANGIGARATTDRVLSAAPENAIIVLSEWHWSLTSHRRVALESWVELGGRLVVDRSLVTSGGDFEKWSGIDRRYKKDESEDVWSEDRQRCRTFMEEIGETLSGRSAPTRLSMCDVTRVSSLTSEKPIEWALRDASGIQAMRVAVGRGRVTVINATPFRYRSLFDGDHGWLFVAAADVRRGDEVHFLSEDRSPSLLALVWQSAAPVVISGLLLVALLMWRGAVRLGPLEAPARAERRSLAEQIRGTGQFALRHGGGQALHAASVRALEETARRRVPGYAGLASADRGAALERLSGFSANQLLSAAYNPQSRGPHQLRSTIAIVEAARRQILVRLTRTSHGTH